MRILTALALTVALASQALAQMSSGSGGGGTVYKIGAICSFDMQQYCKGIPAKRIRDLKECLSKNERNLLPRCQDHYKEARP